MNFKSMACAANAAMTSLTRPTRLFARILHVLLAVILACALVAPFLSGCSGGLFGGDSESAGTDPIARLNAAQQIAKSCPDPDSGGEPQVYAGADATGSSSSPTAIAQTLANLEDLVTWTAVCGGHIRVSVFAGSATDTATVLDRNFPPSGATRNAQLRAAMTAAEEAIAELEVNYGPAVGQLANTASDIIGQFQNGSAFFSQISATSSDSSADPRSKYMWLFTDGLQNTGPVQLPEDITVEQATELAAQVPVPDLSGVTVTLAGIGKLSDGVTTIPSDYTAALVAFYTALAQHAAAASVQVVSDYQPFGQVDVTVPSPAQNTGV